MEQNHIDNVISELRQCFEDFKDFDWSCKDWSGWRTVNSVKDRINKSLTILENLQGAQLVR